MLPKRIVTAALLVVGAFTLGDRPGVRAAGRGGLPNLVILSIVPTSVVCQGGNKAFISVQTLVKNTSLTAAANLSVNNPWNIILSYTPYATPCPNVIDSDLVGGPPILGPGATFLSAATLCVGSPGGGSHIGVSVDPNNVVVESRENDNYKALPLSFDDPCQ